MCCLFKWRSVLFYQTNNREMNKYLSDLSDLEGHSRSNWDIVIYLLLTWFEERPNGSVFKAGDNMR